MKHSLFNHQHWTNSTSAIWYEQLYRFQTQNNFIARWIAYNLQSRSKNNFVDSKLTNNFDWAITRWQKLFRSTGTIKPHCGSRCILMLRCVLTTLSIKRIWMNEWQIIILLNQILKSTFITCCLRSVIKLDVICAKRWNSPLKWNDNPNSIIRISDATRRFTFLIHVSLWCPQRQKTIESL